MVPYPLSPTMPLPIIPSSSSSTSLLPPTSQFSLKSKQKRNIKTKQPPYPYPQPQPPPSYPKPTPTPLLPTPTLTSTPLTQQQALLSVLHDIQSSVDRGVSIDDPSLFSSLLETCYRTRSPLRHVSLLHSLIPSHLLRTSADLSSKLLRLYAASGRVDHAHHLFDLMPQRNKARAFPWNSLISGYADLGQFEDALAVYHQMEEDGVRPDRFTFPRALKACAGLGSLRHGEAVHRHAVRCGLACDPFVLNALVDMYAKCGDIVKARNVFNRIKDRDSVSWNSMIAAYFQHGLPVEALDAFRVMVRAGFELDFVTVSTMLAGASRFGKVGLEIHGWVLRRGLESHLSVANALIGLYSEHEQLNRAVMIFESMPEKDLVSWNAIISAHRRDYRVLALFRRMEDRGPPPDRVTFVSLLSACANLGMVEDGQRLFSKMKTAYGIKPGMEHYGCIANMLGRAGLIDEAYEIVSKKMPLEAGPTVWGALLFACSVHGDVGIGEVAAERLFELEPDNEHNFELMMKIYRNAGRSKDVERVKKLMRERGLES